MKVILYVSCAAILYLGCLISLITSENTRNQVEQQFMNALEEESAKMKRPFCNAFTGCGRKRSFHENPGNLQDLDSGDGIQLPVAFYKALLRAATQNVRNTIDRDRNSYQFSGKPETYLPEKIPFRKRFFDAPSTSSD